MDQGNKLNERNDRIAKKIGLSISILIYLGLIVFPLSLDPPWNTIVWIMWIVGLVSQIPIWTMKWRNWDI